MSPGYSLHSVCPNFLICSAYCAPSNYHVVYHVIFTTVVVSNRAYIHAKNVTFHIVYLGVRFFEMALRMEYFYTEML